MLLQKQKYVYYSCHNSKRICTKKWIKEEVLLEKILTYFDTIKLTDEQIHEVIDHINQHEALEYESLKSTQERLNKSLNLAQERISKLIDMHIDGKIDSQTYHLKLEEYSSEKQRLLLELKSYTANKKIEALTAQDVLKLAQRAKQIFLSSKIEEKQELLRFFFSNLRLHNEKLDVELRMPFKDLAISQDQTIWRG